MPGFVRFVAYSIHAVTDEGYESEGAALRGAERVVAFAAYLFGRLFFFGLVAWFGLSLIGVEHPVLGWFFAFFNWFAESVVLIVPVMLGLGLWLAGRMLPRQTGWDRLADAYTAPAGRPRVRLQGTDGQMGELAYHNYYRLGATREGVQLAAVFLIRLGHPRLHIPWSVVRLVPVEGLPVERDNPNPQPAVRLVVTTHPGVELYVTRETFDRTNVLEHAPAALARAFAEAEPVRPGALRNFGALPTA